MSQLGIEAHTQKSSLLWVNWEAQCIVGFMHVFLEQDHSGLGHTVLHRSSQGNTEITGCFFSLVLKKFYLKTVFYQRKLRNETFTSQLCIESHTQRLHKGWLCSLRLMLNVIMLAQFPGRCGKIILIHPFTLKGNIRDNSYYISALNSQNRFIQATEVLFSLSLLLRKCRTRCKVFCSMNVHSHTYANCLGT